MQLILGLVLATTGTSPEEHHTVGPMKVLLDQHLHAVESGQTHATIVVVMTMPADSYSLVRWPDWQTTRQRTTTQQGPDPIQGSSGALIAMRWSSTVVLDNHREAATLPPVTLSYRPSSGSVEWVSNSLPLLADRWEVPSIIGQQIDWRLWMGRCFVGIGLVFGLIAFILWVVPVLRSLGQLLLTPGSG